MALDNFSIFYYGHEVTVSNNKIDFNEGASDLIATINVGFYSLTEYLAAVESALNDAGTLIYTVSVNRTSRLVTIEATGTFSLLFSTGASATVSARDLLGFGSVDVSAAATYTASLKCGDEYRPQFILQDYVDANDNLNLFDSVVNKSANGRVQVISFGNERKFEMSFKFITDLAMDNSVILNNPSGVQDARDFFEYIVRKVPIEFMPNVNDRATYYKVILESTAESKIGTAYKLKELVGKNIPGVYESGKLEFRLID